MWNGSVCKDRLIDLVRFITGRSLRPGVSDSRRSHKPQSVDESDSKKRLSRKTSRPIIHAIAGVKWRQCMRADHRQFRGRYVGRMGATTKNAMSARRSLCSQTTPKGTSDAAVPQFDGREAQHCRARERRLRGPVECDKGARTDGRASRFAGATRKARSIASSCWMTRPPKAVCRARP